MSRFYRKNKGFTLVELVVVMVILGVLAAVMVPALLSYMDKQKREQVVMNAKDCLMSAQTLSSEQYTYGRDLYNQLDVLNADVGNMTKLKLTGSDKDGAITYVKYGAKGKDLYTIHEFRYTEDGITAIWKRSEAKWIYSDEEDVEELTGIVNSASEVADNGGNSGGSGNNSQPSNPTSEEPTSEEPTTEEPTSEEPTSEEPTSEEPTTEEPTTEEPTTEEPTTEEPTTEEPTTEEPTTEEPTTEEPTTEEPTTEEPVINANIAGGELIIIVDDEDVSTGKYIKDSDFWPEPEDMTAYIAQKVNSGEWTPWEMWTQRIYVEEGDLIFEGDDLYVMRETISIEYGNALNGVSKAAFAVKLDLDNIITSDDFESVNSVEYYIDGDKGTVYYDEIEKVLYATIVPGGWYVKPTKESHDRWVIIRDLNENADDTNE